VAAVIITDGTRKEGRFEKDLYVGDENDQEINKDPHL
jgi:hypothetical protein